MWSLTMWTLILPPKPSSWKSYSISIFLLNHVQYTKGRLARGIGILYKARKCLKESSMKTLYHAFIYPYFTNCITVWGNTFNSVLEHLIVLQKRTKRIVCGAQKFDHIPTHYSNYLKFCLSETYMSNLPSSSSANISDNPFRIFFLVSSP